MRLISNNSSCSSLINLETYHLNYRHSCFSTRLFRLYCKQRFCHHSWQKFLLRCMKRNTPLEKTQSLVLEITSLCRRFQPEISSTSPMQNCLNIAAIDKTFCCLKTLKIQSKVFVSHLILRGILYLTRQTRYSPSRMQLLRMPRGKLPLILFFREIIFLNTSLNWIKDCLQ